MNEFNNFPEVPAERPLSPDEKLSALLYQYLNLHDRWSEDRLAFAKRGAELSDTIAAVQQEVDQLAHMRKTLGVLLAQELQVSMEKTAAMMSGTLEKESANALGHAKIELEKTAARVNRVVNNLLNESAMTRLSWAVGAVALSLLGAMLITKLLLPRNLVQLSYENIRNMGYGQDFVMMSIEGTDSERKWIKTHWEKFKNKERSK